MDQEEYLNMTLEQRAANDFVNATVPASPSGLTSSDTFSLKQLQAFIETAKSGLGIVGGYNTVEFDKGQAHAFDLLLDKFPGFAEKFKCK